MVSSNEMMLGGEHGMLEMPLPVLAVPPAWALGLPLISATLPDADKIENKPQKPNHCAPGAISNSLRYLAARGVGPVGAAPITEADLAEILGTSEQDGTPADWPERKRDWFNANPQHQICTEILEGAGGDVIAKVVQAIRDGKDVELDLQGTSSSSPPSASTPTVSSRRLRRRPDRRQGRPSAPSCSRATAPADGPATASVSTAS